MTSSSTVKAKKQDMTPKEKAIDLIHTFQNTIWKNGNPNHIERHAKGCAQSCVDEIISTLSDFQGVGIDSQGTLEEAHEYWKQVKLEIDSL